MPHANNKWGWEPPNIQHAIDADEFYTENVTVRLNPRKPIDLPGRRLHTKGPKGFGKPLVRLDLPDRPPLIQCECGDFMPFNFVQDMRDCEQRIPSKFPKRKAGKKPVLRDKKNKDLKHLCHNCRSRIRRNAGQADNLYERIKEQFDDLSPSDGQIYLRDLLSKDYLRSWELTAADRSQFIEMFVQGGETFQEIHDQWHIHRDPIFERIGDLWKLLLAIKMDGVVIENPENIAFGKHHLIKMHNGPPELVDKFRGTRSDLV